MVLALLTAGIFKVFNELGGETFRVWVTLTSPCSLVELLKKLPRVFFGGSAGGLELHATPNLLSNDELGESEDAEGLAKKS